MIVDLSVTLERSGLYPALLCLYRDRKIHGRKVNDRRSNRNIVACQAFVVNSFVVHKLHWYVFLVEKVARM